MHSNMSEKTISKYKYSKQTILVAYNLFNQCKKKVCAYASSI